MDKTLNKKSNNCEVISISKHKVVLQVWGTWQSELDILFLSLILHFIIKVQ